MSHTPPTNPEDCFALSPYGFGPFPEPGESVDDCPSHPVGGGYGGVFAEFAPYGLHSYGSYLFTDSPLPVSGGYGGFVYGENPYGSKEVDFAQGVSGASSLSGSEVELFFIQDLDGNSPAITDIENFTLESVAFAAPIEVVSIRIERLGGTYVQGGGIVSGVVSLVLTHTGSTLGGLYRVSVKSLPTFSGQETEESSTTFLSRGDTAQVSVTQVTGDGLRVQFSKDLLDEDLTTLSNYSVGLEEEYPVSPVLSDPVLQGSVQVDFTLTKQTSLDYLFTAGPSQTILLEGSSLEGSTLTDLGSGAVDHTASGVSIINSGSSVGFSLVDESLSLVDGTTTRTDLEFNLVLASSLADETTFEVVWQDSLTLLTLYLSTDKNGDGIFRVVSGGFDTSVSATWDDQTHTLSIVRNIKSGAFVFLLDDLPLISTAIANISGPSDDVPSLRVRLLSLGQAIVSKVDVSASETLYTLDWNFIHNQTSPFTGSDDKAVQFLQTRKGPLVRGWGDGRPARVEDVSVYLGGVAVEVSQVNPFLGRIYLSTPIPRMSEDDPERVLSVDYTWMRDTHYQVKLGVEGLVLGQFIRNQGKNTAPTGELGVAKTQRFHFGSHIGFLALKQPQQIAHRFTALAREESSLLGLPSTLVLGGHVNRNLLVAEHVDTQGQYLGISFPEKSITPWGGFVSGEVSEGLLDLTEGLMTRFETFSSSGKVQYACRFESSSTQQGIFQGVVFGFYTETSMVLCAPLLVNDVRHIGLLKDPSNLYALDSWSFASTSTLTTETSTQGLFSAPTVPQLLGVGSRFQVLSGDQSGVYTITALEEATVRVLGSVIRVQFDPPLPENIDSFGNAYPEVSFEIDYQTTRTFKLDALVGSDLSLDSLSLDVSGLGSTLSFDALLPPPTIFPESNPQGAFFWGHLSEGVASSWSFVRYAKTTDQIFQTGRLAEIYANMDILPEEADVAWSFSGSGSRSVDSSSLTLKSDTNLFPVSYGAVEGFLTRESVTDLRAKAKVVDTPYGIGDLSLFLCDKTKFISLNSLLLVETDTLRQLLTLPNISFHGRGLPVDQGWSSSGSGSFLSQETFLRAESDVSWSKVLDSSLSSGVVLSYSAEVVTSTAEVVLDLFDGTTTRRFQVQTTSTQAQVLGSDGSVLVSYAITAPSKHTYKFHLDTDSDAMTFSFDGTPQAPSVPLTSLPQGDVDGGCVFTQTGSVDWYYINASRLEPSGTQKTLGILKDSRYPLDIDSYELPRTDASPLPNSSLVGPEIETMDWTVEMALRLHKDPAWGVTLYRPDLAAPPYYTPEDGSVGSGFISTTSEPSLGWINVEYAELPLCEDVIGSFRFGSLQAPSLAQTEWSEVHTRTFKHPDKEEPLPIKGVLGRFHVVNSSEYRNDRNLESATVKPKTSKVLDLNETHVYASSIYKVVDGSDVYTSESFLFENNQITLIEETFSTESVKVLFVVDERVVTKTYLENAPLEDSNTILREGTPSFVSSMSPSFSLETAQGSALDDSVDLNTPLDYLNTVEEGRLVCINTFQKAKGTEGLLSLHCDGGVSEGASGYLTSEESEGVFDNEGSQVDSLGSVVGGEVFEFSGSAFEDKIPSPFSSHTSRSSLPLPVMYASGGRYLNASLNGSNELSGYTPAGGVFAGGGSVEVPEQIQMNLSQGPSFEDSLNTPTSSFVSGSIVHPASYSRFGPWGGLDTLTARPDEGIFVLESPVEGSQVRVYDRTGLSWIVFTAKAVPVNPTDFSLVPNPHTALANSISENLSTDYSAESGLTLAGQQAVFVYAKAPSDSNTLIETLDGSNIFLRNVEYTTTTQGKLAHGSKVTQSSLFAGDSSSHVEGRHDPTKSILILGGGLLDLPMTSVVNL